LFRDPWGAFDGYIRVLLDRGEEQTRDFLARVACRDLTDEEATRALKLLEMERHGQLMFTSCAWFFDEISGIETVQVLRFAARAIQLAEKNFGVLLEEEFLDLLEQAPSNHPEIRDGKELWQREVRPAITDLERVLAHFAIDRIFRKDSAPRVGHSYLVASLDASIQETGHAHFAVGAAEVVSLVTLERTSAIYAVVHFGGLDVQFFWMPRDEQRNIVQDTLRERVEDYQVLFEQLFDQDHALLKRLAALRYPIPEPMRMAAKVSTERRIRELARRLEGPEDLQAFAQLLEQAKPWGYRPEASKWERFFLLLLEGRILELLEADTIGSTLARAGSILDAAGLLEVKLNLWNIQSLYVEVCRQRAPFLEAHRDAVAAFASRLQLNPGVLSLGSASACAPAP